MKLSKGKNSPFWDYIKMKVISEGNGQAELRIDIFQELYNRNESVQGGVLATLIDGTTGAAVASTLSQNETVVTTELKINYLLPGTGEYLIGKGEMKHKGKTLAVAQAEVYNSKNQLIALGMASFMILKLDN